MKNEVVIVSDLHIGDPDFTSERKQLFFDFLDRYVKPRAEELILLGDILELTQASLLEAYRNHADLLMKFAEIAYGGTRITYLLGNHDFDLTSVKGLDISLPNFTLKVPREQRLVIRRRVPRNREEEASGREVVPTFTSAMVREIKGKRVYLAHGHEYNHYFAGDPKRYEFFIKVGGLIERHLGPEVDDKIFAGLNYVFSKLRFSEETPGRAGGIREDLISDVLAARDVLKFEVKGKEIVVREEKIDVVVFGHTHRARKVKVRDRVKEWSGQELGVYLNTGAWVVTTREAHFCVFRDDGSFEVCRYLGEGRFEREDWWEPGS